MANFNKVIIAGNLTRDPQLSYLPNNTPVCEFGVAINRKWKSQEGEAREEVCFVDVRAYGRQAETLNQYMKKGKPILIEGRLKFDQWQGKDGEKRSKLSVVAETFQFLGAPGDSNRAGADGAGRYPNRSSEPAPARPGRGGEESLPPPMEDTGSAAEGSEIPF